MKKRIIKNLLFGGKTFDEVYDLLHPHLSDPDAIAKFEMTSSWIKIEDLEGNTTIHVFDEDRLYKHSEMSQRVTTL